MSIPSSSERGGHDRAEAALLQGVLDLDPLLARDRPVVGPDQLLLGEVVSREARRSAPRRSFTNTIVERCARIRSSSTGWIDGQIERRSTPAGASGASTVVADRTHILDRHDHLEVERLAHARVDDRHRRAGARVPRSRRGTARSPRAAAGSPTARSAAVGRSPSASSRSSESIRCAPRFVAAIAWISSTITVVDVAQGLARRRREHQVERLGCGDQDVGRVRQQAAPLPRVGVAGADADAGDVGQRSPRRARPRGRSPRAAHGGSSRCRPRALAAARGRARGCPGCAGAGLVDQPVDRPQERRERLARTRSGRATGCAPRARSGASPAVWASVGASNEASNQARVSGENASKDTAPPRYREPPTRAPVRCGDAPRPPHRARSGNVPGAGAERRPGRRPTRRDAPTRRWCSRAMSTCRPAASSARSS